MHLGVAGPFSPREFASDFGVSPKALPIGLGGTPVNHLVRAWLDMGLRVSVATLSPDVEASSMSVHGSSRLVIAVGPYRRRNRARDSFLAEREATRQGLLHLAPDVVSAHWSYEYALGAISTGLPTLVTVHDAPARVLRMHFDAYRIIRWAMHRQALSRASHLVFNSPYTRAAVRIPPHVASTIVPNPLPERLFQMGPRIAPEPQTPVFVSVNNGFSKLKNVHTLLGAFQTVRRSLPGARLVLVGREFETGGAAYSWARARDAASGVSFLGPLPYNEVLDELRAADALVHPSLEESFGYTLLEAAAVGTPVIGGARSGAVPWLLDGGSTGVLTNVHKPLALARSMLELVTNQRTWRQLRETAHHRALERFGAKHVARDYLALLERIRS